MDRSRVRVNDEFVPSDLVANAHQTTAAALPTVIESAKSPFFYWEAPSGFRMACGGSAHTIATQDSARLSGFDSTVAKLWRNLQYDGPAVARPRFVCGRAFESKANDERWSAFPTAWGLLPAVTVSDTDDGTWMTTVNEDGPPLQTDTEPEQESIAILENDPRPDGRVWRNTAREIRRSITNGPNQKVVFAHARDIKLNRPLDRRTAIECVRAENPESYIVYVEPEPNHCFVTATPERLVRKHGSSVHTEALAGSTRRGRDCQEDLQFADALDESHKNSQEHSLVVAAITETLESLGGDVEVGPRRVTKLTRVQHLKTPINAVCPQQHSIFSLVDRLHPTPAVGGTPTASALDTINRFEPFGRGWYAAPVGWMDANGDGVFTIGIRSGVFTKTNGRIFAGAGIVAESDVHEEWDECQLKYRPLIDAFDRS